MMNAEQSRRSNPCSALTHSGEHDMSLGVSEAAGKHSETSTIFPWEGDLFTHSSEPALDGSDICTRAPCQFLLHSE